MYNTRRFNSFSFPAKTDNDIGPPEITFLLLSSYTHQKETQKIAELNN